MNKVIFNDAARICKNVDLTPLKNKTVLITGASGMIGTYLLATLTQMGEHCQPRIVYAHHQSPLSAHTEEIVARGGFTTVQGDLSKYDSTIPRADIIIHAAGYGQPARFTGNPLETIGINTLAVMRLLERLNGGGRFLYSSSSEVYSGLKKLSASETDIGLTTPQHPRAAYIEGKRCGEAIVNAYNIAGSHARSARISLAYGPGTRVDDTRALNQFIQRALTTGKIELMDAGTTVRTYCYITDVVTQLWNVLLHGTQPVYNVGGNSGTTIAKLAKMIGEITGAEVIIPDKEHHDFGAPKRVKMDLRRYQNEFGKSQYIGMRDGLDSIIQWQRGLYAL
jgi:nucleoside-diphosphate-sugar epimerase